MLCPKCGNAAKDGTFVSSHSVTWIGKGQDNDKVKLPGSNFFLGSEIPAWRCPECRMIFLFYTDKGKGAKQK